MGIFQVQCCTLCSVTASCDCKIFSESCLGSINVTGFLVVIDNRLFLCQSWGSHTQQPSCVDKRILADICIPEAPPLGLFHVCPSPSGLVRLPMSWIHAPFKQLFTRCLSTGARSRLFCVSIHSLIIIFHCFPFYLTKLD